VTAAPEPWRFDAIGTRWEIVTERRLPTAVRDEVVSRIDEFDRTWSRFRADSAVSAMGRTAGEIPAPADAVPMLDALEALSNATAGAVNPLIGASLDALGYDAGYTLHDQGPLPAPSGWQQVLTWD
jgi:thiamine biosynthesis lipoprotein